jgi:AAA domain, putative AbiEii toxin, Type IV TA system/AAA ATPase domain
MIRELTLENFRAFGALHLTGLARVNLLVGANNSGKTSVLEAVALLASGGDPAELHLSLSRRGEQTIGDEMPGGSGDDAVDVRHIFFGRRIDDDIMSKLAAVDASGAPIELRLSTPRVSDEELSDWRDAVTPRPRGRQRRGEPVALELDRSGRTPRYLKIDKIDQSGQHAITVALLLNGGLTSMNTAIATGAARPPPVVFVSTSGMDNDTLASFYERIIFTREEANVVAALREVEPGIARLATRTLDGHSPFAGQRRFVVGMEGAAEQVPLGSLGDGVHRMLAIALSLVAARGGYLLIDEIDTGLHHTVMRRMWGLVFETAKRLDVTVFATTHSYDCVHALAAIAPPESCAAGEVSLIRVERGNPEGVHFNEVEIGHLAEWQIEAR